jgi:hypothetical protein
VVDEERHHVARAVVVDDVRTLASQGVLRNTGVYGGSNEPFVSRGAGVLVGHRTNPRAYEPLDSAHTDPRADLGVGGRRPRRTLPQ